MLLLVVQSNDETFSIRCILAKQKLKGNKITKTLFTCFFVCYCKPINEFVNRKADFLYSNEEFNHSSQNSVLNFIDAVKIKISLYKQVYLRCLYTTPINQTPSAATK